MISYTIVAGFLGAGKTSLINGLLQTTTERLAVVVNDLGDLSLDALLLDAQTNDDVIELANGCVCCSIGDSLAVTLRDLCLQPNPPDRIVLECSGAADPTSVAKYGSRNVLADPQIITVADATDVRQRSTDRMMGGLVDAQLRAASLVAVSKLDLLDEADRAEVLAWLSDRVGETPFVAGHPHDLGTVDTAAPSTGVGPSPAFSTTSRRFDGLVEMPEVEALLVDENVVRAKGLVKTSEGWQRIEWSAGTTEVHQWTGPPPPTAFLTTIKTAKGPGPQTLK